MSLWNPADYARNSAAQWQWAKELQSRLALRGTESMLDLGCGDGKITAVQNPYFFYSAEEYRPWLANSGFVTARVEMVPKPTIHPGPEALTAWIRTTWMPITNRVPEPRREAFIRDFVSAYIQRFPPDPQENIHVQMVRLEVDARKR